MKFILGCVKGCLMVLLIGCSIMKQSAIRNDSFSEYINENKKKMIADGYIIKDRQFRIQVPKGMVRNQTVVGAVYTHIFDFSDGEKIVVIDDPVVKQSPVLNKENLSHRNFVRLLDDEDLLWTIEEKFVLERKRRFGIYKPEQGQFYVVYLNVKIPDLSRFNYSITSLRLK